MTIEAKFTVGFALLCAVGAGCGSSGGGPGDGGATRDTGIGGTGVLTWREGGTAHTAPFAAAAMARSSTLDLLQITGAETTIGLSFGIAVRPPPLVAGFYACGGMGYPIVSFTYTGTEGEMFTCAVELTSVGTVTGAHAVGRFSATLGVPGGGSKVITDGQFDIPATVSSL
jgi:hypothetical protein